MYKTGSFKLSPYFIIARKTNNKFELVYVMEQHEDRVLQIWCILFAIDNKKCHIYIFYIICIYMYIYIYIYIYIISGPCV